MLEPEQVPIIQVLREERTAKPARSALGAKSGLNKAKGFMANDDGDRYGNGGSTEQEDQRAIDEAEEAERQEGLSENQKVEEEAEG